VLGPSQEILLPVVEPTVAPVSRSITSISMGTLLKPETLTLCLMVRTGAIFADLQTETDLQETVFALRARTVSLPLKGGYPRPLPQLVNKRPKDPTVTTRPMVRVRRSEPESDINSSTQKTCKASPLLAPHRNSDVVGLMNIKSNQRPQAVCCYFAFPFRIRSPRR
jgi:hypothetical protein